MFTPVGSLLKTLPKRSKTPEAIVALHVRRAFGQALLMVCADLSGDILSQVKAKSFKNGVLEVRAPSLIGTELAMRAGSITSEVNNSLGRKVVFKIRFKNY